MSGPNYNPELRRISEDFDHCWAALEHIWSRLQHRDRPLADELYAVGTRLGHLRLDLRKVAGR